MNLEKFFAAGHIKIIAKPGMPETKAAGWDENRKALKLHVHAKAEDNKANLEIIKFFAKLSHKKVQIVAGLSSKEKLLRFS